MFGQKQHGGDGNPFGGDTGTKKATLTREAPESSGLLKEIDASVKAEDDRAARQRTEIKRILDQCGC